MNLQAKQQHPHSIVQCLKCGKKRVVIHCIVYEANGVSVKPGRDFGCEFCAQPYRNQDPGDDGLPPWD